MTTTRTYKDHVALINETVNYYTKEGNKRSINQETKKCFYYFRGLRCAVGRCLRTPRNIQSQYGFDYINEEILENLKPQYKGFSLFFWEKLQELHDDDQFWYINKKGNNVLTLQGKEYVKSIKKYFK